MSQVPFYGADIALLLWLAAMLIVFWITDRDARRALPKHDISARSPITVQVVTAVPISVPEQVKQMMASRMSAREIARRTGLSRHMVRKFAYGGGR